MKEQLSPASSETSEADSGTSNVYLDKPSYKGERKTHSRKRRLLSALTATALVAGGVVAFEKFQDRRHTNNAVTSETHGIEKSRLAPQQNLNSQVVLREGAVYSDSPEKVTDRFLGLIKGNMKIVSKGSVIVMSRPRELTVDGKTIYAAAMQPTECNVIEDQTFVSSSVIAERMNVYALADQGSRNDEKIVDAVDAGTPISQGKTVEAAFNNQGQMLTTATGNVVACAAVMPASALNFMSNIGGIAPNTLNK